MPETEFQTDPNKPLDWEPSEKGIAEVYANIINVNWSLYDVRLRVGQIVPSRDNSKFIVEERAAVTIPWHSMKHLHFVIGDLIARYERANGELKAPVLP